jgi:hypothetical protein
MMCKFDVQDFAFKLLRDGLLDGHFVSDVVDGAWGTPLRQPASVASCVFELADSSSLVEFDWVACQLLRRFDAFWWAAQVHCRLVYWQQTG